MAKPKNPDKKTTAEELQSKLDRARQARLAMAKGKKLPVSQVEAREQFRVYWTAAKKEFNRGKDLEDILWAHLKSIKHDKPELFEAGVLNFGLVKA